MIPSRRKERMRQDGYMNAMFGQGFRFTDPFSHYRQGIDFVSDQQCSHLYTYNGIAKAIIDIPADEAMRNGFEVEIDGMDGIPHQCKTYNLEEKDSSCPLVGKYYADEWICDSSEANHKGKDHECRHTQETTIGIVETGIVILYLAEYRKGD